MDFWQSLYTHGLSSCMCSKWTWSYSSNCMKLATWYTWYMLHFWRMLHLLHDRRRPWKFWINFCYCWYMFFKVTFGGQLLTLSYWTPWGQFVATQLLQFATGSTEPPGHRRPVPDPWLRSYSPSTMKNRELVSFKPSCFSQYAIYLLGERVKTRTLD